MVFLSIEWWTLSFVLPLTLQAHLLQYPHSKLASFSRAAFTVPTCFLAFLWSTNYIDPRPLFTQLHFFIFSIAGCYVIFRSLEWGFVNASEYTWTGKEPISSAEHTLQVLTSMRGINFEWGTAKEKLPAPLPREIGPYIKANLKVQAQMIGYLTLALPIARTPGWTFAEPPWPHPQSKRGWFLAYFLQAQVFGVVGWAGLELAFENACLSVCLMQTFLHRRGLVARPFDATDYPPMSRPPWGLQSVKDFWGYRWHRMMTRTFIMIGLRPIRALTSPILGKPLGLALGAVGAYVSSGILHEWGTFFATPYLRQNPQLPAYPSMLFFASQGVLMVLEMVFEHVTGRKVRGWPGKVWAVVAIGAPASVMVEDWLSRGIVMNPGIPMIFWPNVVRASQYLGWS